jgi:prepilin-type N-terminal cleavage/methylation domain-containing protein
MHTTRKSSLRLRPAFTLVELVIVLVIMGVIGAMAIPKVNISNYRVDAAAQQVRSVYMTAQRTSLTRQYDVIVSVDTIKHELRIAEDKDNNGSIDNTEWKFWRPPGEGNRFAVPPSDGTAPKGVNGAVSASVVGQLLTTVNSMPSVTFHRDGSTSSNAEVYIASTYAGRTDWRAITLTRSTGRTELYRLSGTGPSMIWQTVGQ